ncbi:hypothetical protein LCI18_007965 [Fusarium solani-melongenae]|uniref:Uncharacterized protein n=1 Tax=Fusarium solani subsp. cucurbitae TaxID=2747967 RepID=A0ACD3Z7D5_FUSSC|nr:hypothetical protein LCI18_007965 [Fusarium solani-melongenae]
MDLNLLSSQSNSSNMAMNQQLREAVIREIIHEEILIEQRHELAALATLLLSKAREEEDSSNSYETSYEYYEEDEEEDEEDPSSVEQPQPTGRKRTLPRNDAQIPVPQKRQRINPTPAVHPQPPPPQEIKRPETPPEAKNWMPTSMGSADNSHRHPVLQAALRKAPITYARPVAQTFLEELDCDKLGALDVAKAVFDMGIRYSKMASDDEFNIVFCVTLANPRDAIRYNIGTPSEKHMIFWGRVQRITHRAIPPDPFKTPVKQPERKAEVKPEPKVSTTRTVPAPVREKVEPKPAARRVAAPVREKPRGNLKASLVKEVDEKTKIPLNERVRKWLDEVVSMDSGAH